MHGNRIPMTSYRMKLRDRILNTAMAAFAERGIKAVKMDDIAQCLSISKRTLYEIYDNKELLLYEGIKKYKLMKEEQTRQMMEECQNVMDIILRLYRQKVEELKQTNPLFYSDIEKYPRVLLFLEEDREVSHQLIMKFLLRGVEEGYFREQLDYELVSGIFSASSVYVMTSQLYHKYGYGMEHIFRNLLFVYLRGICTAKGIEVLDHWDVNEGDSLL